MQLRHLRSITLVMPGFLCVPQCVGFFHCNPNTGVVVHSAHLGLPAFSQVLHLDCKPYLHFPCLLNILNSFVSPQLLHRFVVISSSLSLLSVRLRLSWSGSIGSAAAASMLLVADDEDDDAVGAPSARALHSAAKDSTSR